MFPGNTLRLWLFAFWLLALNVGAQPQPPERDQRGLMPMLEDNIARPLRYTPIGTDFVITNGREFFNRPLYGNNDSFRVDAGDKPEFSLYLPGHGGNLRLGIQTSTGATWLNDCREIIARYRPGSMVYEVRDPLLGEGVIRLSALPLKNADGLITRAELENTTGAVTFFWAFGGANGMKGRRNGDIGCEREPVSQLFQLNPEQSKGNTLIVNGNLFLLRSRFATLSGLATSGTGFTPADAREWSDAGRLLESAGKPKDYPVALGQIALRKNLPVYLAIRVQPRGTSTPDEITATEADTALTKLFSQSEANREAIADREQINTPDPFINAAAAALNVAADAIWDDKQQSFMHGAVAWRVRLLGWRGQYAGDELGWHERTAEHFAGYARQQNTNPIPAAIPEPEASANLARNETALHSNGDLTKSHYDMNLVGVDAFFRHLLWTGDLDYARQMWPVIERHLAWERRLFRREFGPGKLPLYEGYADIWASDDLAYNGGGSTEASAYNLYHNRMAARVAKLIGKDPTPYEQEADLIARGMQTNLWLADRGWFAEWKDLLGLQLVHPNAAVWTFYHALDCDVPTPLEAWQMTRFVDTQIARIPLRGPGVPDGCCTMPTTSWMPYTWSLNNVVMAETMHTALAYWQAGRTDGAFPIFKGALLDSMYLGLCPGNVGMCTYFDAYRRESQRDFADGIGITSRSFIEGLFGVHPDLLADEINIRPGFPSDWNHASIHHPDFEFSFHRDGLRETWSLESHFSKPLTLRLQVPARRDRIAGVTVNGTPAAWRMMESSVGTPRVEITATPAARQEVQIEWHGQTPRAAETNLTVLAGTEVRADCGAKILELADPQHALSETKFSGSGLRGFASGRPGQRTIFARVEQGDLRWWQPVSFAIKLPHTNAAPFDWSKPVHGRLETVNLSGTFNDRITQIFRNEYLAPRSPFCSLATPKQGIGSWCHPNDLFNVDDSGLSSLAAKSGGKIILPDDIPLATPVATGSKNIAFVSQWTNYPAEISVPLNGKSAHAFLLMAGSTTAMQSRFDNGEVVVTYADGSTDRLALRNPTTWWPIDQDYFIDDFAFRRPEPLPVRVDLKTGKIRVLKMDEFKGKGGTVPGGAATVLDLPLDANKELQSLTVRALANEVVIGLMSLTLERPARQ